MALVAPRLSSHHGGPHMYPQCPLAANSAWTGWFGWFCKPQAPPRCFWGPTLEPGHVKVPFGSSSCDENMHHRTCKTTPEVPAVETRLMWASQNFLTHRSGETILVKQMWRPTSLQNHPWARLQKGFCWFGKRVYSWIMNVEQGPIKSC